MNKVSLDVRSEIMDKVEEIQPDILVLGARGLGTVRGYLHHHDRHQGHCKCCGSLRLPDVWRQASHGQRVAVLCAQLQSSRCVSPELCPASLVAL